MYVMLIWVTSLTHCKVGEEGDSCRVVLTWAVRETRVARAVGSKERWVPVWGSLGYVGKAIPSPLPTYTA